MEETQVKLCECGCGQPAPIAIKTRTALGHVKGRPIRFINGHRSRLQPPGDPANRGRREAQRLYPLDGVMCWCGKPATEHHHIDGDPTNNAPENVAFVCRWCHMWIDGRIVENATHRHPSGEQSSSAKLTAAAVREIRRRRAAGERGRALAAEFGVHEATISAVVHRRNWKGLE